MNSKLVKNFVAICLPASVLFGCAGGSNNNKQDETIEHAPAPYGPVPSAAQLNWHEMETYCLIHFTPTTFENKEWGYGDASPSIFNPVHFDASQIAAAARSAGLRGLVSVAKHHDGFCLFPTKATDYNISKSPWRDGKGDMVKEFMEAARKQGMQFGAYCSAWDRNDPAYGTPEYVQHYRQELTDLYSNYGPLFISWHDGANGGDGYYGGAKEKRTIDRSVYYNWPSIWEITRKLQPGAVIFSDIGPDVRWVGNERGMAGETCWATFTPVGPEGKSPAPGFVDDRFLTTGQRDGKYWIPAECDVPLRPGWFYHPDQDDKVKSPDQLFDLYLQSVGRGACLNLGLSPNTEGLLHNNDVASLKAFGDKLNKTFADNLAKDAVLAASNIRDKNDKAFGTAKLTDDDRYSYWATDDKETSPELIIDMKEAKRFNIIRLRENIKLGQRLDSVVIEQWQNEQWQPLASATSIGSTRLIRLPEFITTQKLRVHFFAPVCIALSDIGLFAEVPADYTAINKTRQSLGHAGWKAIAGSVSAGSSQTALAFDGDKNTFWQTAAGSLPQQITIDLGGIKEIKAFSWLPRQDKQPQGLISKYIFETSTDGKEWTTSAEGEFSNIAANPVEQYVPLKKNIAARFIRLQATAVAGPDNVPAIITIAELNVF